MLVSISMVICALHVSPSVLVESYIYMYIYMYTYVGKYKYGHMCTTCMTLSTSRVIHTVEDIKKLTFRIRSTIVL